MKFVLILSFSILSLSAQAVVNYRNGNYYQEFTDAVVPVGKAHFTFKRTYNSASNHQGLLGLGWGMPFETHLSFIDSAIVVKEMGNGRSHVFVPVGSDLEQAMEKTLKAHKEKYALKEDAYNSFKTRLLLDPQALESEVGGKEISVRDGEYQNLSDIEQKLRVSKDSIDYTDSDGSRWSFGKDGALKSLVTAQGFKLEAKYDKGQLISLLSPEMLIDIERTPQGAITGIKFGNKGSVKYIMDKGELNTSVDQNNETYVYEYDKGKLSKISGNEFEEKVSYNVNSGKVATLTDKEGKVIKYNFTEKSLPHPTTKVEITSAESKPSVYEYEERVGKIGPYLYRRSIQQGRSKEEIVFDDCCSRPLSIDTNAGKSEFKYNAKGLPTWLKLDDGKVHEWNWNEKDQLTSYIGAGDERKYEYDNFGPIKVVSKKTGTFIIKRNPQGQILETQYLPTEGDKKEYHFQHSADGKSMALITAKGEKAFVKETAPGRWEMDSSKKSDLQAKLELLGWLQTYQGLALPPDPKAWLPTI